MDTTSEMHQRPHVLTLSLNMRALQQFRPACDRTITTLPRSPSQPSTRRVNACNMCDDTAFCGVTVCPWANHGEATLTSLLFKQKRMTVIEK